jgi:hypothetical protein
MTSLTSHCLFLDNATINCHVGCVKRGNWQDKMSDLQHTYVLSSKQQKTTGWNES